MARLISGATGFVGSALINHWFSQGVDEPIYAFTRSPEKVINYFNGQVKPVVSLDEIPSSESMSIIVNLAGEPILDKRWSESRKQTLYDSRIETTKALIDFVNRAETLPKVFISGSAIGFYGSHEDDQYLGEDGHTYPCFAHKLCADWENLALQVESKETRVCVLRTGIVLGDGGALAKMLPPFKFGLGGPIASGQQWMSWIDLTDMIAAIDYLINHETLRGPFNLTAPEPVRNAEFTKLLAATLGRPAFFPMPAVVLKLLLGEGAELLVEGQRVVPNKLLQAGFEFSYPTLTASLRHCLK